jgi:hypothetical protein
MKKITISLFLILTVISSCDEILEVSPRGKYLSENYYKNDDALISAISGLYRQVKECNLWEEIPKWDICSDDYYRHGDHSQDPALETFTFDAANKQLQFNWSSKYEVISRANNIIMSIKEDNTTFTPAIKSRSLGEAYFFRAWAYWWLYLPYGEIPLISEEDVTNLNYNKPKATINEVFTQIESDLKASIDYLNPKESDGRAGKGSAYAYLCQLYMHWSCIPGVNADEKLNAAIQYGELITKNDLYKLTPTYLENFRQVDTQTSELLFSFQSSTWASSGCLMYFFNERSLGGWGFWEPFEAFYNLYDPRDVRRGNTMLKSGVDPMTSSGSDEIFVGATLTGIQFCKYLLLDPSTGKLSIDMVIPLMRSADVYLLVAEAKIRKSGAGAGDAEINAVRKRTGLPDVSNAGKDELILERRLELVGEVRRHFDVMRWDKIGWVDAVALYSDPDFVYPADRGIRKFNRPKNYYFPLPQTEIDKSKGVLIQNPEYTN